MYERFFFRKKPLAPPAFPENGTQREILELFESTNNYRLFDAADGGRTRTLSPERDFKSLVSASLRQSRFYSLYRLISHCERDFSFASEGDSHFFIR